MVLSRDAFDDRIYDIWATYFSVEPDLFHRSGTNIKAEEWLKNSQKVYLNQIGKHTIAQCDAEVLELMTQIIHKHSSKQAITLNNIQAETQITDTSTTLIFYLYPTDFKPYTPTDFSIRQLSTNDKEAMDVLKSACTPEDVDEGWGSVDDELGFGAFEGETMVACATMFDWRGFADPGVLVHPDYRKRGLGKAVVSPICEWVLEHDRVMTYRCDAINIGSAMLAKRLGFQEYFSIDAFKLIGD